MVTVTAPAACARAAAHVQPIGATRVASAVPQRPQRAHATVSARRARRGCLADGSGYLRTKIQGAVRLRVDWHNAELECAGSPRPNHRGVRISFAGPLAHHGRRLRLIFGVASIGAGESGRDLPTNVTVIFQGERRLYSTLSQSKCTTDRLRQRLITRRPGRAIYRIEAHGFCIDPLTDLLGHDSIVMSRFDFVGRITYPSASS